MIKYRSTRNAALGFLLVGGTARAQKPPAIRPLGRIERISTDSLASVFTALPMPDGRVLVNDIVGRRVLLFDSTLTHSQAVADTTAATSNAYGARAGALVHYRGDTALFIDQQSLSMLVISPMGAIVRVMAIPRPADAPAMMVGPFGTAAVDAAGRLVYVNALGKEAGVLMLGRGDDLAIVRQRSAAYGVDNTRNVHTDSACLVRVDPATRVLDTVASLKIPTFARVLKVDDKGLLVSIQTTPDALPLVDGWAMMSDGSIAVLRTRDYHVDWLDASGRWSSTPKMPFDWQPVTDARKQTLIDSAVAAWQVTFDRIANPTRAGGNAGAAGSSAGSGGRGGGSGSAGPAGATSELAPNIAVGAALGDLPGTPIMYGRGKAVYADAEGDLWIRTSILVKGQPVYDVVNRRGELFDRVQLPPFRTIAGFGPGVIYMAVKDADAVVHLERARIR